MEMVQQLLVDVPTRNLAVTVLAVVFSALFVRWQRSPGGGDAAAGFALGGERGKSRLLGPATSEGVPANTRALLAVKVTGLPDNPPRALALHLKEALGLTAMPMLQKAGASGLRSVLFASEADAAKALAATNVALFGRTIKILKAGPALRPTS